MNANDRLIITIAEAAQLLGLSESTVYRLARENKIPVVRIGASVRVNRRQLEQWIDSHTEAA
jgi:excisionase family DNA binding protein